MRYILVLLIFYASCKSTQKPVSETHEATVAIDFNKYLDGLYASNNIDDTDYKNQRNLSFYPLFRLSSDVDKWYYMEESNINDLMHPFRQRVYRIIHLSGNQYKVLNYTILDPEKYVVALNGSIVLERIPYEILYEIENCDMILKYNPEEEKLFGETNGSKCKSSINNATYSKTYFEFHRDTFKMWDRGYDEGGKQVWGEHQPTIYIKQM